MTFKTIFSSHQKLLGLPPPRAGPLPKSTICTCIFIKRTLLDGSDHKADKDAGNVNKTKRKVPSQSQKSTKCENMEKLFI
jgi:hypothetical protein